MSEEFERFKLKSYKFWDLYLDKAQFPYLGRCYAAAKRPEADVIGDMTKDERDELFNSVFPEWESVVKALFSLDRPNLAILGNTWNHLHVHLIPRYNSKRIFEGIEFIDPNPKGNYAPYPKRDLDEKVLLKIRDLIIHRL